MPGVHSAAYRFSVQRNRRSRFRWELNCLRCLDSCSRQQEGRMDLIGPRGRLPDVPPNARSPYRPIQLPLKRHIDHDPPSVRTPCVGSIRSACCIVNSSTSSRECFRRVSLQYEVCCLQSHQFSIRLACNIFVSCCAVKNDCIEIILLGFAEENFSPSRPAPIGESSHCLTLQWFLSFSGL